MKQLLESTLLDLNIMPGTYPVSIKRITKLFNQYYKNAGINFITNEKAVGRFLKEKGISKGFNKVNGQKLTVYLISNNLDRL